MPLNYLSESEINTSRLEEAIQGRSRAAEGGPLQAGQGMPTAAASRAPATTAVQRPYRGEVCSVGAPSPVKRVGGIGSSGVGADGQVLTQVLRTTRGGHRT